MKIAHDKLIATLEYDPVSGIFTRRDTGKVTGYVGKNGYVTIRLLSKLYYAHQLAWFYVHKVWSDFIDHRNNVRTNNWIKNLRESTQAQNNKNVGMKRSNRSGYKGVSFCKAVSKWQATIVVNRVQLRLGFFLEPKEAALAYDAAAVQHHGEFAKTNKALGLV